MPVTGEPDKVVETPANSTDVPDQAGLENADTPEAPDPFLVKLQVLLDRADASPGVIDGFLGGNTKKAIRAYETMQGLPVDGEPDARLWEALTRDEAPAVKTYAITEDDVSGRYVDSLPHDYAKLAKMSWLGFHDPAEMLAEKFHMDEELLKTMNGGADFNKAGTKILVAAPEQPAEQKVLKIKIARSDGTLFGYGKDGKLIFAAPATVGSNDTPSPSGTTKVVRVAPQPTYEYRPDTNFTQGDNKQPLTLPPGPNGPVGIMWIDLKKPTYGIHGTPDPALIGKTSSHGCVRLTNWDAQNLSKLVVPDQTVVEFTE